MGNSNIQETKIHQDELNFYKYSSLYGRYEIKNNRAIKIYELPQSENDAFVGLTQTYQKIDHPSLITIENIRYINQVNHLFHYQLSFPFYAQTLADQIVARNRPYNQKEIVKLIIDIGSAIQIFHEKQFPYGYLMPEKIAVKQHHQGYCIGIDILMNPKAVIDEKNKIINSKIYQYLSPEQKQTQRKERGFERAKSTVYSLGIIALKTVQDINQKNVQQVVFEMRRSYSYELCNLLASMLRSENHERIQLYQCLDSCKDIQQMVGQIQIEDKTFIRGYNCVQSLLLFDEVHQSRLTRKWRQKYNRK